MNKNLLLLFYKDKDKNDINEIFYNQFISNNIINQNKIYNYFYKLSDISIDIIKSIINFIKDNEKLLDNYIYKYNLSSSMKSQLSKKNNCNNIELINNLSNSQVGANSLLFKKMKIKKNQISNSKREKSESNSALVEDKETSFETESIKKEEKIFKRKINNIERNIVKNLYKPTFEKSNYLRKLNSNMKNIKNMTLNYSKFNFIMKQKKNEIDLIGNQMLLYNNPNLHPDELSNPIYNNINNLMINKRNLNLNNNMEKRFRSTYTNRKYKFKI